jgi:hypothetical protein
MPSGEAQVALMKSVYEKSGLDPKATGYVEAHGTGTKGVYSQHKMFQRRKPWLWALNILPSDLVDLSILNESNTDLAVLNSRRSH